MSEPSPRVAAWWRIMDLRMGIVPLPVGLVGLGVAAAFVGLGGPPSDILMSILVLGLGGFACAEIGKRVPGLKTLGLAAILATFLPSYLVYAHLLPTSLVKSITAFTDQSNFLYLFIAAIIVGSILGMDRRVLVAGFLKIFAPLAAGSIAATAVGCAVGTALGLGLKHSFFMVVAPIMAGGVGEGAIPLTIGYAQASGQPQGVLLAQVLPAVMLGSLTAILLAGGLNALGKRYPALTGEGRLQPGEADDPALAAASDEPAEPEAARPGVSAQDVAAALILAVTLYLIGALTQKLWKWPGPVVMLALAVVLKFTQGASPRLERGAFANFKFFSTAVTYPLLFAIGVAKTPWESLVAAFNLPTLLTIAATVSTLIGTGFAVGRLVGLYPVDAAIVTACHSGQGGTGDVAILTAAGRMQLMPFAQIATRIGGAIMVTLTLIAFVRLGAG
ncbi:2-hydroxycarboxylate transporter family protein [Phenylobacterium sp.]|jgi:Na+/citrate or Na+/malate symporter|uniref:2-hydroxycarboxylate transporter family protein n=1 Tax=Phenylobacterium sp. TaxID=1871053 RepID=UPI002F42B893